MIWKTWKTWYVFQNRKSNMNALLNSKIQPCLSFISFPVKVLLPFLGLIQVPPCNYLSCPSGLLWSGSISDSFIVFHCLDSFEEYWELKYSVECPQFEFTLYFFQLARATGFWKGYQDTFSLHLSQGLSIHMISLLRF